MRPKAETPSELEVEELRVDVFGPSATGVISGRVLVDGRRREEFRAEVCACASAEVVEAIAETPGRSVYLVSFDLDRACGAGRLRLQRVEASSPLSVKRGDPIASPVYQVACQQRRAGVFRQLELTCRPDALLRATPSVRDAIAIFQCAETLAAELGLDIGVGERSTDTVEAALSRAGIAVSSLVAPALRQHSDGERLLNALEGVESPSASEAQSELLAWSPADLDELVADQRPSQDSAWRIILAVVPRLQDRPQVVGTMFSTQQSPRRGCALCVAPAGGDAWTGGDRRRALRFAATHELGHALNLLHAFEAERTTHRPQPRRAALATFMNYPNRYPFGSACPPAAEDACRELFWRHFDGTFGHDERVHLRHGWENDTRPGGAIEAHMLATDGPPAGKHGLHEAGAGTFSFEGLAHTDPNLAQLFGEIDSDPERGGQVRLRAHLPSELELGEPVIGWFAVENDTAEPQPIPADLDPAGGQVIVDIKRRGAPAERFVAARRDCGAGLSWLLPGERRTASLQLSFGWTCYFTELGAYRVTVALDGAVETSSNILVRPPANRAARDQLDGLFTDERLGLAIVGAGCAAVASPELARLTARQSALPTGLASAITELQDRIAVREARDASDLEQAVDRQLRRSARITTFRWREHIRSLHQSASAVLLRDDLPAGLVASLARRIAHTSLALCDTHAGGSDELGTSQTATAILNIADRL